MQPSEYFKKELEGIKNPQMREFATKGVDFFPPYFMVKPASSSGKYHAPWENITGSVDVEGAKGVAGGLARHTKAMCYVVNRLAPAYMLTDDERDATIISVLFHDSIKFGFEGGRHTLSTHESLGATFFKRCVTKFGITFPLVDEITKAIYFHAGRWALSEVPKVFPEDFSKIGQLTHIADMVCSSPDIEFTFINNEEESLIG